MRKIARLKEKGHKATAIWIDESIMTLSFKLVRVWRFKRKRIRHKYEETELGRKSQKNPKEL